MTSTGFTACGKDPEKCRSAQDGVRQSLKAGDSALVTRWREYAYKQCSDNAQLTALDKEIADSLAAAEKRKNEAARLKQETGALVGTFTGWVAGVRNAPETASATPSCEGTEAQAKSKERWCNARRQASSYVLEARYWEKEPSAARFTTRLPGPATCQDLGPGRTIRTWTIPGTTAKRSHCELTGGSLAGLQALVVEAINGPLEVFSVRFLELDQAFSARVNGEGR
jgi:hypothetical protein